jgi:hypothetical protein
MAIRKFPARLLKIFINDGTEAVPVWVPIKGLNTLAHSPSTTRADSADMDSEGHAEHMVMERGDSWTLTGRKLMDVANGDADPGQALVEELGTKTGLDSHGDFRLLWPDGSADRFFASAEITKPGGGHNDLASWNAALTVSGATTAEAAP